MTIAKSFTQGEYPQGVKSMLARSPSNFINGEWVPSSGDRLIPVFDPSTGKEITKIIDSSTADVDNAVAAARVAFEDGRWRNLPPLERSIIMNRLADLIDEHAQELSELEAVDNGKPVNMAAHADLPASAANLRYYAGWCNNLNGQRIDPVTRPSGGFHAYTRKEPVGVAVQIIPWNFPLIMATNKIAPALAAGCTMILKPAEQTSLSALRLADLIQEAGVPDGVINIVTGYGHTVGDYLVKHPGIDKVAFTGSTEVGKLINRNATDTMKNVTLELGGKSPVIVMPDVDIQQVAENAAGAIFFNSGQLCVAGSRLYAHTSVFDSVLEAVVEQSSHWAPSASLCPDGMMGPLVSDEQLTRVTGYIDAGLKEGASVAVGGKRPCEEGYYLDPTVLVDVSDEMTPVREEIFGPVLVAQRFNDINQVIEAANNTVYGLGASVWTNDLSTMHTMAAQIKSGTVWGNCHAVMDPAMPFGGFKQSGIGREYGVHGIEAYTEEKSVIIQM